MSATGRPAAISVAIMTHPARMGLALALRRAHPELDMTVVLDPAPDDCPTAARAGTRAWGAVAGWATHHLVLEDDAILHPAFAQQLDAAVSSRPDSALCFFTEWGSRSSYALRLGALRGACWAPVIDAYVPCLALCLPAEHARALGASTPSATVPYDVLVGSYLRRADVDAFVSIPNLADHGEGPSLVGNSGHGPRRAACFLPGPLPAAVAVTAGPCAPGRVPCFSWEKGLPWYYLPDAAAPGGGRPARMRQVLGEHGMDFVAVLRGGRKAAAEHRIADDIRRELVDGLWLTAFGLGAELRAGGPPAGASGAPEAAGLTRAVPRAAMATMPDGALRTLVSPDALRHNRSRLRNLVEEAVMQGVEQ